VIVGKVGRGKVLTPPLDRTGTDLPPSSVRATSGRHPIHGLIEVHAYTDSDDDDKEEESPATSPRSASSLLLSGYASTIWMSA